MNPPFYFIKKCVCFPKFFGVLKHWFLCWLMDAFVPPVICLEEAEVLSYNQNFKRRSLIGLETCVE